MSDCSPPLTPVAPSLRQPFFSLFFPFFLLFFSRPRCPLLTFHAGAGTWEPIGWRSRRGWDQPLTHLCGGLACELRPRRCGSAPLHLQQKSPSLRLLFMAEALISRLPLDEAVVRSSLLCVGLGFWVLGPGGAASVAPLRGASAGGPLAAPAALTVCWRSFPGEAAPAASPAVARLLLGGGGGFPSSTGPELFSPSPIREPQNEEDPKV